MDLKVSICKASNFKDRNREINLHQKIAFLFSNIENFQTAAFSISSCKRRNRSVLHKIIL
jgi:hypothetical protein